MKKALFVIFFLKVTVFLSQDLPSYLPVEGLLAWFPFNGTTEDKSKMGYHAVNFGAQATEDRFKKKNSALYFNGIGNYVSLEAYTDDLLLTKNFTISIWVSADYSPSNIATIFSKGDELSNEYSLTLLPANQLHFPSHQQYPNALFNYTYYGSWTHVVCQIENGVSHVFIDGREAYSYTLDRLILPSNLPFVFGALFAPGTSTPVLNSCFRGKMDDIAIWNRVLSPKEIKTLYKGK